MADRNDAGQSAKREPNEPVSHVTLPLARSSDEIGPWPGWPQEHSTVVAPASVTRVTSPFNWAMARARYACGVRCCCTACPCCAESQRSWKKAQ
jgi:hypothetical protein